MDGGNGERGENGHSKAAREADSEGIEEDVWPADGFLRFSSVRVSWIWRIRLVCSPPKALRLLTVLTLSLSISLSLLLSRMIRTMEQNEAERNERATCQSCQTDAASRPEEKLSGNEAVRERRGGRGDEEDVTDLLFVTRVCVNSSSVSVRL